jgi:hypothetical protein
MDFSPSQNTAFLSRKRARQLPTFGTSTYELSEQHQAPTSTLTPTSNEYIKGLTDRQRVNQVLSDLNDRHRWSLRDLLHHMVTAEPENKNERSTRVRAKIIADAVFMQETVLSAVHEVLAGQHLISRHPIIHQIQHDIQMLQTMDHGFGSFDADIDPTTLDIPGLTERVKTTAPFLWHLLSGVMNTDRRLERDTGSLYPGFIFMICNILALGSSPYKSNGFPTLLGVHLHSME